MVIRKIVLNYMCGDFALWREDSKRLQQLNIV